MTLRENAGLVLVSRAVKAGLIADNHLPWLPTADMAWSLTFGARFGTLLLAHVISIAHYARTGPRRLAINAPCQSQGAADAKRRC